MNDIQAIVFKNDIKSQVPKVILVHRRSTGDLVRLNFSDEGQLLRFTHLSKDKKIHLSFDIEQNKYITLPSQYHQVIEYQLKNKKWIQNISHEEEATHQNFYVFAAMPPWNLESIHFTRETGCGDLDILMNGDFCCQPNYIKAWNADIYYKVLTPASSLFYPHYNKRLS